MRVLGKNRNCVLDKKKKERRNNYAETTFYNNNKNNNVMSKCPKPTHTSPFLVAYNFYSLIYYSKAAFFLNYLFNQMSVVIVSTYNEIFINFYINQSSTLYYYALFFCEKYQNNFYLCIFYLTINYYSSIIA